ncbi:MAG: PKD domain-containing protein [Euryarchaeota archaeon]|nr:PKD domain-containing protein [Euryarchaeota archaeon]
MSPGRLPRHCPPEATEPALPVPRYAPRDRRTRAPWATRLLAVILVGVFVASGAAFAVAPPSSLSTVSNEALLSSSPPGGAGLVGIASAPGAGGPISPSSAPASATQVVLSPSGSGSGTPPPAFTVGSTTTPSLSGEGGTIVVGPSTPSPGATGPAQGPSGSSGPSGSAAGNGGPFSGPEVPFAGTASLVVLPGTAGVGAYINFDASGFTSSSPISITWAQGTPCSGTTDASGDYSCSILVPPTPAGLWTFTGTDGAGRTGTTSLQVYPTLTSSAAEVAPGTSVTFTGSGFGGSQSVTVSWPVGTACTATTSTSGAFSCSYTIPVVTLPTGYAFTATDAASNTASVEVIATTGVAALIAPAHGSVGSSVQVQGVGFAPYSSITVKDALSNTVCTSGTNGAGAVGCSWTLGASPAGSATFTVADASGSTTTVTFQVDPSLSSTTAGGPPGTSLSFSGTGFGASSTVTLRWTGGTVCSVAASTAGSFGPCAFTIPAGARAGDYNFTATDVAGDQAGEVLQVASPPALLVVPGNATVGHQVSFYGSGFAPSAGVSVVGPGGTVCTVGTDSQGAFSCAFTVPAEAFGPYTATASDGSGHSASSTVFVVASASLSTAGVGPGGSDALVGTGFAASTSVSVSAAWAGVLCTLTTSAQGGFPCNFIVPLGTAPGSYVVNATDAVGHTAGVKVSVLATPSLSVTPATAPVNSQVTFDGSGFAPSVGTSIYAWVGGICSVTPAADGTFSTSCILPDTPAGGVAITAADSAGDIATTTFYATAVLTGSTSAGPVGTPIDLAARGLHGNASVTVSWSPGTACTGFANRLGDFGCSFTIPSGTASGPYVFSVSDGQGSTAALPWTVTPAPAVAASASEVTVGQGLTFFGSGFVGGSSVGLTGLSTDLCSTTANGLGSFSCGLSVPSTPPGSYTFTATDAYGNSASGTLTVVPSLSSSPTSIGPGGTVEFQGSGFASSSAVALTWIGGTACTTTSDGSGDLLCTFAVPASTAPGTYAFTARDASGNLASALETVGSVSGASVELSLPGGVPGVQLWVNGSGFAPASSVTVSGATGTLCTATSDAGGSFSCVATVPAGWTPGTWAITAADAAGTSAAALFEVLPPALLMLNPGVQTPGQGLSAFGEGFLPGGGLSVQWSGGTLCGATVDAHGEWNCGASLPSRVVGGTYIFTAWDSAGHSATSSVLVEATLSASIAGGPPGSVVQFSGDGYAGSTAVTVAWGGGTACVGTSTVDGHFVCAFTVPAGTAPATYGFTASDGKGNGASTKLHVGPMPSLTVTPGQGAPGTPASFIVSGFLASSTITVSWGNGVACGVSTDALGDGSCSFPVPAVHVGLDTVKATDPSGDTASTTFNVVPGLTESLSGASAGSGVLFQGEGYAGGSLVSVTYAGGTACSSTTGATGSFSCQATVAAGTPPGDYIFTAKDASNDLATILFQVTGSAPVLSATPGVVTPGANVELVGNGFGSNVYWWITSLSWTGGGICQPGTNVFGSFSCGLTIPSGQPGGSYVFSFNDGEGHQASTTVVIAPSLTVSSTTAPTGDALVFSGSSFPASTAVAVSWTPGTACTATTDTHGSFACTLVVPGGTAPGSYTFDAIAGGLSSATSARVVGAPSFQVLPGAGPEGSSIFSSGNGFLAGSATSVISAAGVACNVWYGAGSDGSFTCGFSLSGLPAGGQTLTARDGNGDAATAMFTVVPELSLSLSSGGLGTSFVISGTGYAASSTVTVTWDAGTACTATTDRFGSFACVFSIGPTTAPGSHGFTGRDASGNFAGNVFTVTTTRELQSSPPSGQAGTSVLFEGSGFAVSSSITLAWTQGTACTATSSAQGAFSCTFAIPAGTAAGAYGFTATDGSGGTASTTFTVVTAAAPSLSVTPSSGPVGASFDFTGSAFTPSSGVQVSWSGGGVCGAYTSTSGTFSCTAVVPAMPAGPEAFTAVDGAGLSAVVSFTVNPRLVGSPTGGPGGTSIEFRGTGFAASGSVSVTWSGGTACTTSTDSAGSFLCFYVLPVGTAAGSTTFTATDGLGHSSPVVFQVTGTPALSPSPNHGPVGTSISLSGSGFAISSGVVVSLLGNVECTVTTDSAGAFSCGFQLPPTPAGSVAITATDGEGNTASTPFIVDPSLTSSIPGGPSGIQVVFSGTGYGASLTVSVTWTSGTACSTTTDVQGSFSCSYVLPGGTTVGSYAFTGTDSATNTASLLFEATGTTGLTESTSSGPVGTSVAFSATGLVPNVPYWKGGLISWSYGTPCDPGTSATGTFTCSFNLPAVPHGTYTFTASDGYGDQPTQTFTVTPALGESVVGGPTGTPVEFQGTGYAAGSAVSVTWTSGTACTATTDTGGSFGCVYSIPSGTTTGSYAFTGTDASTNTATVFFQVTGSPTLTPSPLSGPVGTSITLSASGLVSSVAAQFYGSQGQICSVTTSATGTASCGFTLPATPAGTISLFVQDAYGNTAATPFVVTSSLAIAPGSGPAGTTVVLTGSGFGAYSATTVTWTGGGPSPCSLTSGGLGSFLCTFLVPVGTAPGGYTFTATDASSNTASSSFTVNPTSPPVLSLSTSSATFGTGVEVQGTGFAVRSPVTVSWTWGTLCTGTTDGEGAFSCTFFVGSVPYGAHTVTATDGASNTATASLQVNGMLSVAPGEGRVGTVLSFSVTGLTASAPLWLNWSRGVACTGTTSALGAFSCPYSVPTGTAPGTYGFTATDRPGHTAGTTFQVVSPALALSPTSGPQGGTVVATGTYFAALSSVWLNWSRGTACTATTNSVGEFSCSFVLPLAVPAGSYTFTATDRPGNSATASFTLLSPNLAETPGQGPTGTSVTFAGSGFAASSSFTVTWSGGTACSGTTNAQGVFTCSYTIPLTTSAGSYTFTATDGVGNTAGVPFTVTTPMLTAVPPGGPSGIVLTIEGSGFTVSSTVTVTWPSGTVCSVATTPTGTFVCTFTLPAGLAVGSYGFSATDAAGAGATLLVVATGTTTLLVSVSVATPGTSVAFYGTGYVPGANVVVVGPIGNGCSGGASSTGTFSCGLTLPGTPFGTDTFTASDGWDDFASTSFKVVPVISATVYGLAAVNAPAGSTVDFRGAGFAASSAITLTWDGGAPGCTATSDLAGSFSCSWTVPKGTVPGSYGFTAVDGAGNAASLKFYAGGFPQLSVSPGTVPAGTAVTIGASGFLGNVPWWETWINWTYGNICNPGTSSIGRLGPCTYTIPSYVPDGRYGVTAADIYGDFANGTLVVGPSLTAAPTGVATGGTVTFTGAGFSALTSVTLTWSGGTLCTLNTAPDGSFSCRWSVPAATAPGTYDFGARDSNGHQASVVVTVVPAPEVSASPSTTEVGASVNVVGSGFGPSVGQYVTVSWNYGTLCSVWSNGLYGVFSCSFTVPTLPAGRYLLTATDSAGDVATTNLTLTPTATVLPAQGGIGASVTVSGLGFAALSSVQVRWSRGLVCTALTDVQGTFSCTFTVPVGTPGGSYALVATDASGNQGSTPFTVSPGAAAALAVAPAGGPAGLHAVLSGTGFAASSAVTVSWSGGTACTATTDPTGSFTCVFVVPVGTAPGTYGLTATDGSGDTSSAVLAVSSGAPLLVLSAPSGTSGSPLYLYMTGFAFSSTVTVTAPGWGAVCTGTATGGDFSCTYTLPTWVGGGVRLTANDSYGDTAWAVFNVVPVLSLSLPGGAPGTLVQVQGASFAASASVTVNLPSSLFCTATTDPLGSFSCSARVPAGTPAGEISIDASDSSGNRAASLFYSTGAPTLSVLPGEGPVGSSLSFQATGFPANSLLSLGWAEGNVCQTTSDGTGQASCSLTIADTPAGATLFTMADSWGDSATTTFSVFPTLALSVYAGPTGTTLDATARGFAPSAPATVWVKGTAVCTTTTTPLGDLSCTFVVPSGWPVGSLEVLGSVSGLTASAIFFVTASLSLALSPSTGPVGTPITFVGSGFLPQAGVTVSWLEGIACGTTADALGSFTCSFTLPDAPAGSTSFSATDGSGGTATASFTVTPSFADSPKGGPVGTLVTFTGTGFASLSSTTVTYSGGTACTATTDSRGDLTCTFSVPAGTAVGSYVMTATDASGNKASALFEATGTTTLSVTPTATVGSTVTLTGAGFAPNLPWYGVGISWTYGSGCSTGTSPSGTFTCSFVLPTVPGVSYLFTATDTDGNTASATMTVVAALSVGPAGGPIGSEATFRGNGFHASSSITVTWTSGTACTGSSDLDGVFSCVFTVPTGTAVGGYTFTATDGSGNSATTSFYATGTTVLTASVTTGPYGTGLTLSGTGYTSSVPFTILFQGGGFDLVVCSSQGWPYNAPDTTSAGTLSCSWSLPAVPAGTYTFTARDQDGISASASFTATPSLVLSAPGGPVGAPVKFTGYGFAAASAVTVSWSGGTACTATTAGNGTFSCAFSPGATPAGSYVFTATDAASNSATGSYTIYTLVSASPDTGQPGSAFTVSGSGYAASGSITVTWFGGGTLCTATATTSGSFSCAATVPAGATSGTHSVVASDGTHSASVPFYVATPALTVSSPSGAVGIPLTFSGTAFTATSSYTLTWSGGTACSGTTSASGTFSCSFTVPTGTSPAGYTFTAKDAASLTASVGFTVTTPGVAVSVPGAPPGVEVFLNGVGFSPGVALTVTWAPGTACSLTTSSLGGFTCNFVIPGGTAAGTYAFRATDAYGASATVGFYVTGAPGLTLNPTVGIVGDSVSFTAGGYVVGSNVAISWTGGSVCGGTADSQGSMSCSFTVPAEPAGTYTFTAADTYGDHASATFQLTSSLYEEEGGQTITGGPVGSRITFSGTAFGAGRTATVSWPAGTACTSTVAANGDFTCSFTIPVGTASGSYAFTANDGAGDTASVLFEVTGAATTLADSPSSGPVGTSVTFTGNGFASNAPWWEDSLTWYQGGVCNPGTSATGSFTCSLSIPVGTPAGTYTFVAADAFGDTASTTFTVVTATLTASLPGGPIGTSIDFSGRGYAAVSALTLTWSGGTACSLTTNRQGDFTCVFVVPAGTITGTYAFTATDASSNSASVSFVVTGTTSLTATPSTGPGGTSVTFAGTGFVPNVNWWQTAISWAGGTACQPGTDGTGSFSCGFTIPARTAIGTYTFTAVDGDGNSASATFTVQPPALSLSPTGGPPGTAVAVSGTGFLRSSPITVTWSGGTVCTSTTDRTGSFSCDFTIPAGTAAGSYTFTAADGASNTATATFKVTAPALLTVSPASAAVGTTITITASGFVPGDWLNIAWSGGVVCYGGLSAAGTLSCSINVWSLPHGPVVLTATDSSGTTASTTFQVLASLTASPGAAPNGATSTLSGTGFTAGSSVSVTWTPGTACTATADTQGSFSCLFTVPAGTAAGSYTLTATDGSGVSATSPFQALGALSLLLAPASGAPGSSVLVTGTGFVPSTWDTAQWVRTGATLCSATSSATGTFSCTFTVPTTGQGTYNVTGFDGQGNSAQAQFTVVPALTDSPSFGTVGTSVVFSGAAFRAFSSISLTWSGGTACTSAAGHSGQFQCTFTIPVGTSGGPHTFTATDGAGNTASVVFTETALVLSPTLGPVGTSVTFTAEGFHPSTSISIAWSGGTTCSGTTDTLGSFSCSAAAPAAPAGMVLFTASDTLGSTASATFQITTAVAVSPTTGPVGTTLAITGTGFAATSAVSVTYDQGTLCTATTSAAGSFSCTGALAADTVGAHTLTAVDASSNSASTTFTVVAALSASPSAGPAGTAATFSGTGFHATSAITLTWVGGTACTTASSAVGSFSCVFTIPVGTAGGTYLFNAKDASMVSADTNFTVSDLVASPTSGPLGTVVAFTATGFASSSAMTITWSGGTACSGTTSGTGSYSCTFTIPSGTAPGPYTFTATDGSGNTGTTIFTVTPTLSDAPTSGPVGTSITFTGSNFAASSTVVVTWSGGTACSGTSSANGAFSCTFSVPSGTVGGPYTFTGKDGSGNTATATFTVVGSLAISPPSGPTGSVLLLTGAGFGASDAYTVTWTYGTVCTGTTGVTGAFSCSFTVPATPAGSYTFSASDLSGATGSATFTVVPALSVSPTSGPVGTSLVFTGTGYAASSPTTVTSSGGTACTATTDTTGSFTCSYVLTATPAGATSFTGTDGASNSATAVFTVTPSISLAPTSGAAGASVAVSGSGFAASSAVTATAFGGTACTATTDAFGTFSCSFTVPSTPVGSYTVTATDSASNAASASFYVRPGLSPTPTSGAVGSTFTLAGTGFAASTSVTVTSSLGGGTTTTDAAGAFSMTLTVAAGTVGGTYSINATDTSGHYALTSFLVMPSLSVSPMGGPVGTVATFAATGFPASTAYTLTWSGGTACSGTTTATGTFGCTYTIPVGTAGGPYVFSARTTGSTATATFTVTYISVSPASGPVGTSLAFTAGGYAPTSSFTVTWSGGTACSGTTTATGTFSCSFTLPAVPAGAVTFTGTDGAGTSASTTFTVTPALSASPTSGPVGTSITFSGTGFAATSALAVSWSGGTACTATSSATGSFSCSFALTAAAAGPYTFTATDASSDSAAATFTVTPALGVSPVSSTLPVTLTFTGSGFAATSAVTVSWSGGSACTATSSASGGFSCTFAVPPSPAGSITFTATDAASNTATASFTVLPSVSVAPGSGTVGSSLVFSGTGFAASSTTVVSWTGGTACSATSSAVGSFTCTFALTPAPAGALTFTATDSGSNSASTTFTVTPSLSVAPTSGPVGTSVVLSGEGFAATSAVSVNWAGGTPCTATTGTSGAFTCTFVLKPTVAGALLLTATDASSNSATATFTVTSLLTTSPTSGAAGTTVAFIGSGFAASSTVGVLWTGGTACQGTSGPTGSFSCSFVLPGSASPGATTFTATDLAGNTATASFTVLGTPSVSPPAASPASVDVGGSVSFTTTASGGSGTYTTYAWTESGTGLGCVLANAAKITCSPTTAGNYTVAVTVTDSNGVVSASATSSNFEVFGLPVAGRPLGVPASVDVGQSVNFTVDAWGGSGAIATYTWTESASALGCALANAATITCVPTAAGSYTVSVTVTDANGGASSASTSAALTVSPALSVPAPTASPSTLDVGGTTTLSSASSGGSGGDTYIWTGLPAGCTGSGASFSCTPTAAGTFSVAVEVKDANGRSVVSPALSLTVNSAVAVTASASPTSGDTSTSFAFSATASGGTAPLTYTWRFGDGGRGSGATASHTFSAAGTYTVRVWANDSAGGSSSAAVTVTVASSGGGGKILGLPSIEAYGLFGALAIVVVIALLLMLLRRRKGGVRPRAEPPVSEPSLSVPSVPSGPGAAAAPPPVATSPPPPSSAPPPSDVPNPTPYSAIPATNLPKPSSEAPFPPGGPISSSNAGSKTPIFCSECGASNDREATACSSCGAGLNV